MTFALWKTARLQSRWLNHNSYDLLSSQARPSTAFIGRGNFCPFSTENSGKKNESRTNVTVTAGGVIALVVGGTLSARFLYGQIVKDGNNLQLPPLSHPRRDASRATVLIHTIQKPPEKVVQEKLESVRGYSTLQQVDATAFDAFIEEQRAMLQRESQRVQEEASQVLREELRKAFADADGRISAFCDWYLSYPTTYKFLGIATTSAVSHAVTIQKEQTLTARVSQDLQEHICRKYEALVLRPARTDPQIHRALVRATQKAHEGYREALGNLESSLADFVDKQASPYYGKPPSANDVVVDMDWVAQLQKVSHIPLAYEKTPTVALVAAGAAAGKLAGGGAGVAATKALSAKLAAPFATKAAGTALAGKAAAGATGGAILGGPVGGAVGAVAGAAVGLGIDMTVNAGVALVQRGPLEQDIREALAATLLEWEERLLPELERVQLVWFDHAASVLNTGNHVTEKQTSTSALASLSEIQKEGSASQDSGDNKSE